jgi:cytochrome c-type biogenesis protein CcmE
MANEEKVPRRRSASAVAGNEEGTRRRGVIIAAGSVGIAGLLAALFLLGMKDNAIYSKPVDDLLAHRQQFMGRPVRVDGNLVHGSLMKRESPCEYKFTITKNGVELPVRYEHCTVPDTFRDVPNIDVGVTAQGELQADGSFEASDVLAKCPSKYEMQQQQQKGEKMPHAAMGDGTSMR